MFDVLELNYILWRNYGTRIFVGRKIQTTEN